MLLLVAGGVVLLILFAVYRSPILPFVVIVSAIFALALAGLAVYLLADAGAIALNGQSQGILFILVFGAATDYALLLVARYREELRSVEDKYEAIRTAWRSTLEPIAASAATVIAGVLCLLLSDLNSNRGLGPVAAIGIAASFIASMTFLPAALVLLGRTAFWPTRPKVDPDADRGDLASAHRFWNSIAQKVGANPRPIWMVCSIVLVGFALLLPQFKRAVSRRRMCSCSRRIRRPVSRSSVSTSMQAPVRPRSSSHARTPSARSPRRPGSRVSRPSRR